MIKRIIFDVDGTLIKQDFSYESDYFYSCLDSCSASYFIPNIAHLLAIYESSYSKYDAEELRLFLESMTGISFTPSIIEGWRDKIRTSSNVVIDGVYETLDYLKSKNYSLGVLTNWFSKDQIARLDGVGLLHYFDSIVGGEVALKPDLKSYICATGRFNIDECVMIGDNITNDVVGAVDAGMDAIYFDEKKKDDNKVLVKKINNIRQLKEIY